MSVAGFLSHLKSLFRRGRMDDLSEELRFHLQNEISSHSIHHAREKARIVPSGRPDSSKPDARLRTRTASSAIVE